MRPSRPDSGPGYQAKILYTFSSCSLFARERYCLGFLDDHLTSVFVVKHPGIGFMLWFCCQARKEQHKIFKEVAPEYQNQDMVLTVLHVPLLLDSGSLFEHTEWRHVPRGLDLR
jgi:hypothetical protein